MDAPDGPVVPIAALIVSAIGIGVQARGASIQRSQSADARNRQNADAEKLAAAGRENDAQARLADQAATDRRREKAAALAAQGRSGTIKTTPIGAIGSPLMGPKLKIGA